MSIGPQYNLYGLQTNQSGRIELDLREELNRLLYGANDEIAKGREGLLRAMKRNNNDELIRCACRDSVTDEADKDYTCRYCFGWGWLFQETKIVYYKESESFRKREGKVQEYQAADFYLEYDETIHNEDWIIEVKLTTAGGVDLPPVREKYWEILSADPFRADNGRIEFWRVRAAERRNWSVYYDVKHRQFG